MKLSVESISKSYGKKQILKSISFEAQSGECIGFTGPNGCGKTTLLSILTGVEKSDSGTIMFNGNSMESVTQNMNSRIGYVPQINPLPDNLRVSECLKLWCSDKSVYNRLITRYNLTDIQRMKISKLSGGMKRRVALCCALATAPDILIMDEPTAALDVQYKDMIHRDMKEFIQAGGILILVTHEREEMEMCNKCYFLKNGYNEEV